LATTVNTLATAAPMTVPATPRKEAPIVAVTAANALATTWATERSRRFRWFVGSS
jgi:hypothetical protein